MKRRTTILGLLLVFLFALTTSAVAAPAAPTSVGSTSHQVSISSTNNKVTVTWTASTGPNLNGYATLWDNSAGTVPVTKTLGSTAKSTTSPTLSDASNWYFHIRAVDDPGAYSTTVHLGPFIIDTKPGVSAISPSTAGNGSTTNVTVTGTDFMSGATVKIGTTDMTNVVFVSSTELTATIPSGLSGASYDIKVTNPNTKSGTLTNGFTVTTDNTAPTIDAGNNQSVTTNNAVTLSGTATDPDTDDTLTYQWTVTSKPTGGSTSITSSTNLTGASFTPDLVGSYTIQLAVSDGTVTVNDTLTVTANSPSSNVPVANAGTDQQVTLAGGVVTVTLNGSESFDADGDPLTYTWAVLSEPSGYTPVTLSDASAVSPTFSPAGTGTYRFGLVVSDGTLESSQDSVTITVIAAIPISLSQGWNLISLPLTPADTATGTVLAGIIGNVVSVWAYDQTNGWQSYFPGGAGNDLAVMTSGKGYWINMSSAGTLNATGSAPQTSISLVQGWNLVGYGGTDDTAVSTSLSGVNYISIWAYDQTIGWTSNFKDGVGNDLLTFSKTRGYWINMTASDTWDQ